MPSPPDERPPLASKDGDAWVSWLEPWSRRRIETLRDELERPGAPVDELRGRILELREMRNAIDPQLPISAEAPYFPPPPEKAT
jgi:hypothetical protein